MGDDNPFLHRGHEIRLIVFSSIPLFRAKASNNFQSTAVVNGYRECCCNPKSNAMVGEFQNRLAIFLHL